MHFLNSNVALDFVNANLPKGLLIFSDFRTNIKHYFGGTNGFIYSHFFFFVKFFKEKKKPTKISII